MREDIEEMESSRPHAMEQPIETKRESGERSKGLVGLRAGERLAPKVILKYVS